MSKYKNLYIIPILTLVFFGCTKEKDVTYIEKSNNKCEKIVFTCPQYQEVFNDASGCGCKKTTKEDFSESRSLQPLIARYLVNVVEKSEKNIHTFTDYMVMNISRTNKTVNYEVWAIIKKIDLTDMKNPKIISEINSPIILKIEETGQAYIIWDHEIIDYTNNSQLKQLSQKSQDYINSEDFQKNKKEIDLTLAESINAQLELLKQL